MSRIEQLVLTHLEIEGLQHLLGGVDATGLPLRIGVAREGTVETGIADLTVYLLSQEEEPSPH